MIIALHHLKNFIEQVLSTAIAARDYSLAGLVLGLVAPFLGYLKVVFDRWKEGDKKVSWTLFKPSSGNAYIAFFVWSGVIVWALAVTVYKDHQSLVAANCVLVGELKEAKRKPMQTCPVKPPRSPGHGSRSSMPVKGAITQSSTGENSPNIVGDNNKP